jgi:hypothetical protein
MLILETLSAAPDIPTSHVVIRFFEAAPSCVDSDKIYKKPVELHERFQSETGVGTSTTAEELQDKPLKRMRPDAAR